MQPRAWSYSALSTFRNCPYMYYRQSIAKDLPPEVKTDAMSWGSYVHDAFEKRFLYREGHEKLPLDLQIHEPRMKWLEKAHTPETTLWLESKIAFDNKGQVTNVEWWDKAIWYRGVIDFRILPKNGHGERGLLVDYKTGKRRDYWDELAMFAIHTFLQFPWVQTLDAKFYWTVDQQTTDKTWNRADIPTLWGLFLPDLKQWAVAHKTDTWQKRPSGLCHGHCRVKDCSNWRPLKEKK